MGGLTFPFWIVSLGICSALSCLLLAGETHIFPKRRHPLSIDHFRNVISKLPAEVEGDFAETVDKAELQPDKNPVTQNSWLWVLEVTIRPQCTESDFSVEMCLDG